MANNHLGRLVQCIVQTACNSKIDSKTREEELQCILIVEFLPNRKIVFLSYPKKLACCCGKKYDGVHINGNNGAMATVTTMVRLHGVRKIMVHIPKTKCDHSMINKVITPAMKVFSTNLLVCSTET